MIEKGVAVGMVRTSDRPDRLPDRLVRQHDVAYLIGQDVSVTAISAVALSWLPP
jgi:hypothetical protein